MKIVFSITAFLLFFLLAGAQQRKLVTDKEGLFTMDEINRIDSILQAYRQNSGNLVVVCTDSLDISAKAYKDSLIAAYTKDEIQKPYAIFVLLSRKNKKINLESNELTKDMPGRMEEFMKIIGYGVPAIQEKKREEGVTIICKKAMEFLNELPKKASP